MSPFCSTHSSLRHPLASTVIRAVKLPTHVMAFSSSSSVPLDSVEYTEKLKLLLPQVLKYHNQTKHSFTNYARGPRGLDWANQPNPFRRYESAPLMPLQHPSALFKKTASSDEDAPLYSSLFYSLPSPKPITWATISQLFYHSLALSAWKSTGYSTWSLRVNPSSGNLHPTESYILAPRIPNISESPFVAHYAPKEHALEIRAEIPSGFFPNLFPENSFLIGLSSIFWREAWKYGERAFRYCNHDVGHAIAAVAMAAAELGWDVKILDALGHKDLERMMGLHIYKEFKIPSMPLKGHFPEMEFEHPDCLLLVFPSGTTDFDVDYAKLSAAVDEFPELEWKGSPNSLSKEHICWDIIYKTSDIVKKPLTTEDRVSVTQFRSSKQISETSYKGLTVREVVRTRRSAVDMDGVQVMARDTFYQMLLHCLPSGVCENGEKQGKPYALPFRALSWDAEVHAVLFVHRVSGLPKGLYFLVRNVEQFDELKKSTRPDFKWVKPDGCPEELPLYELARGDLQVLAKRISCHQDIAGDGCFSLGMVAHFEPSLHQKGVWMYPRLFWETGVLGQVLYLEAHAVGISATGIGCFFDDAGIHILSQKFNTTRFVYVSVSVTPSNPYFSRAMFNSSAALCLFVMAVHEILGLSGSNFQSLYHFTVGGPVLDKRIMSLPAYPGPGIDA